MDRLEPWRAARDFVGRSIYNGGERGTRILGGTAQVAGDLTIGTYFRATGNEEGLQYFDPANELVPIGESLSNAWNYGDDLWHGRRDLLSDFNTLRIDISNRISESVADFSRDWERGGLLGALNSRADTIGPIGMDLALAYVTGRVPTAGIADDVSLALRPVTTITEPLNTQIVLQGVTDRAVADLAANPSLARELMSPGSYRHLVEGTNLAPASFGKAVERLTARYVAADPELSRILQYQSRPFVSTPDFFGYEGYNLRPLDITTEASIPIHLARPYGSFTDYVIHPGLPPNLVFSRP